MLDNNGHSWPQKNDVAFGHGPLPDFHSPTVAMVGRFLDYPSRTLHADAFKDAADMLVLGIVERQYSLSADMLFFPVAYLYRHAIELLLKEAIYHADNLQLIEHDEKLSEVLSGHALYPLWNKLKPAIEEFWPNADPESPRAAERIIQQFHELDGTGQAFRYPTSKDGSPSLGHVRNPPKVVDMEQLKDVATGLCNFIEGCTCAFEEAWSSMPHGDCY